MLKKFLDKILGIKEKPHTENSQQMAEEAIAEAGPRKEILTGGFVYIHPEEREGYALYTDNIGNAAKFILSAKTSKEKKEREKLYTEVMEREAFYFTNAIEARVQKYIKSNQ